MGSAMLTRWLAEIEGLRMRVVKPSALDGALADAGIDYAPSFSSLKAQYTDIVVLAVKPQIMPEIIADVVKHYGQAPLYVSIAAGLSLPFYENALGKDARVVRAMPNTPVAIGQGVTSLVAGAHISDAERDAMSDLFAILGAICWLEDETQLDAATALAGSGPAYLYLFAEALADAAKAHGLDAGLAKDMALSMIQGAASLALESPDNLKDLRDQVTSKGGTTAAALSVFTKNDALQHLTHDAVSAAIQRAKDINGS